MTSVGPLLASLPGGDVAAHVGAQHGGPVGPVRLARLPELLPEARGCPQLVERGIRHVVLRGQCLPSLSGLAVATQGVLGCGHTNYR